ncbi:MAG: lytic murein transglycosylase B [Granulosicoccus sp.]
MTRYLPSIIARLCLPVLCVLTMIGSSPAAAEGFLQRAEVREYLDEIAIEHELNRNRLSGLFARLQYQQKAIDLITRPAERTLTWKDYRPIFLTDERISAGRVFYEENQALLTRTEQRYGVPAEIIAAIIGVETYYGRITGNFAVMETLATLAFDFPRRAAFFRKELTEFILLTNEEEWNPAEILGSYAGAMGMPQFIASSYRQYAVDFDEDGTRDLFTSLEDITGSVGHYLKRHGWVAGAPVAERWEPEKGINNGMRALVAESLKPMVEATTLENLGFTSTQLTQATEEGKRLSVMTFDAEPSEELWIGYQNFYAITRYNHSRMYALAVFQLAEAIRNAS